MHDHILIKHHIYSLQGANDTGNIFKDTSSEVEVTDNIFQKCIL